MFRLWRVALVLSILGSAASCSLLVDLEPTALPSDAGGGGRADSAPGDDAASSTDGSVSADAAPSGAAFLLWAGGRVYENRDSGDVQLPQSSLWLGKLLPNGDVASWTLSAETMLPSVRHEITGVTAVGSLAYVLVSSHGTPSEVLIYRLAGDQLTLLGKSPATQDLYGSPCVASHKSRLYVVSSNRLLSAKLNGELVGGWSEIPVDTGAQPPSLMVNDLGILFPSERGMRAHAFDADGLPLRGTLGLGDVGIAFDTDFSFQTPFAFADGYIFQLGGYQVSILKPEVFASLLFTSLKAPTNGAGAPIAWRRREPMSSIHRGHSAIAAKGNLYALGGVLSTSVSVAHILPEGNVDLFRETTALPKAFYGNCNVALIEQK
jgi:hypothetical protein